MLGPCQGMLCPSVMCQRGLGRERKSARWLFPSCQIQSGIGRLILREEMKARSNSYADPWTPPRSSASSREALHTLGYEGSLNGCKAVPARPSVPPRTATAPQEFYGMDREDWEKERGDERCWAWSWAREGLFLSGGLHPFPVPQLGWGIARWVSGQPGSASWNG